MAEAIQCFSLEYEEKEEDSLSDESSEEADPLNKVTRMDKQHDVIAQNKKEQDVWKQEVEEVDQIEEILSQSSDEIEILVSNKP